MARWNWALPAAALWLLASCGGAGNPGSVPEAARLLAGNARTSATVADIDPVQFSRKRALAAGEVRALAAGLNQEAELFAFAEANFSVFFPGTQHDQRIGSFTYRHYPGAGTYLIVDESGRVYVLGGAFGDKLILVGKTADLLPGGVRDFEVVSGGVACNDSGCSSDNPAGTGVAIGTEGGPGPGDGDGSVGDGGSAGAGGGWSAVRNAVVTAYKPDGTVLGSAALVNNLVSLHARRYRGPFLLKLVDTGGGEYFDEARRAWVRLNGRTLRAMVPALTHHVSLNPLTEAAYQLALRTAGRESALDAQAMRRANDAVLAEINDKLPAAYRTTDITNYATTIDDTSGIGTLPNTWAGRYSAVLAALPIAGRSHNPALAAPALSYGAQLSSDIVDDGLINASASVPDAAYAAATQARLLDTGICTAVGTWGSAQLPVAAGAAVGTRGQLTLLAGDLGGNGNCDGVGALARFDTPAGVAVDAAGNAYVADSANHTIRKVTPGGVVTTFVGSPGQPGYRDAEGLAARLSHPHAIAIDGSGNLYVTGGSNAVRKISPEGFAYTFVGLSGEGGSSDGTGILARFSNPGGVAVDPAGNVYIADTGNYTIRKVTPQGVVTTLAGQAGEAGHVDGPGAAARFRNPRTLAVDSAGNVYVGESRVADQNPYLSDAIDRTPHAIRKITPAGQVSTLVADGGLDVIPGIERGFLIRGGGDNGLAIGGLVTDRAGNLYASVDELIVRITPAGAISFFAGGYRPGSSDGTGAAALFYIARGLAIDGNGTIYLADAGNNTLRRITPAGAVTTLAGSPALRGIVDGTGPAARFSSPEAVAIDGDGSVYVADGPALRKVSSAGETTTRMIGFSRAAGLIIDSSGYARILDAGEHAIYAQFLRSPAFPRLYAGGYGNVNGELAKARFFAPEAIAEADVFTQYVADTGNHAIRRIKYQSGTGTMVTTLAGNTAETPPPCSGCAGDGSPPRRVRLDAGGRARALVFDGSADGQGTAARFSSPSGITTDAAGNVYVADTGNHTIRKITPAGLVSTFAGAAKQAGSADGPGASARFSSPRGLAIDTAGNLFVADSGNSTIRRITPAGVVSTVVGRAGGVGNLAGPLPASLADPRGVAVRGDRLYITAGGALLVATAPAGGWQ